MSDLIPMTRTGYEKIKAELDHMEGVEMPAIAAHVASARSEGDLSENAEYHGARESQGMLQAKINLLRDKLRGPHWSIRRSCPRMKSSSAPLWL